MQGDLPVGPAACGPELELQKASLAAERMPHLLRMVLDGHPGLPQRGHVNYFSMKDYLATTEIPGPSV